MRAFIYPPECRVILILVFPATGKQDSCGCAAFLQTLTDWLRTVLRVSRIGHVFVAIHMLPLAPDDGFANLRRRFSLAGLFVRVDSLGHADIAHGAMLAGETIEECGVAVTFVAMAVRSEEHTSELQSQSNLVC